jgi:poly(3-hydroxybutyrate) depolymerase
MRLAVTLSLFATPAFAVPFEICADPGGAGIDPGYRIVQQTLFLPEGPRWICVVTPPGYSAAGPDYPLVVVFHGGNQNPQNMMAEDKAILREAVNRGYVAAFAAGLPTASCDYSDLPCETSNWGDDGNLPMVNAILDHAATFNLDEDRIFLAGFSGGARLIYRAIEADDLSLPVTAIATSAGAMGVMKTDAPDGGLTAVNVALGTPLHALLLQAENDAKTTYAGGYAPGEGEIHLPFSVKVDLFRLLTGNLDVAGVAMAGLPAGAEGTEYPGGTHVVQAITGQNGHTWPDDWFAPVVFDFFDRF